MRYLVILAFVVGHVAAAKAQTTLDPQKSANVIGRGCEALLKLLETPRQKLSPRHPWDIYEGECMGIVETWLDASKLLADDSRFCPPDEAPVDQAIRVVVAHLKRNPQRTHESFGRLAHEALRGAWPCKKP
jgi:hypothetical protein